MAIPDFAHGVTGTIFPMVGQSPQSVTKTAAAGTASSQAAATPFTFDDFVDIVNPLQHLPVVSTLYRAVTGDQISDPAQLAGDTLYGGPMGFATSLAGLAFKGLTGKDVGDTVLSMITGDDSIGATPTAVAANTTHQKPAANASVQTAQQQPLVVTTPIQLAQSSPTVAAQPDSSPDLAALQAAIRKNGLDADLGMRATLAYQQSLGLNGGDAALPPAY